MNRYMFLAVIMIDTTTNTDEKRLVDLMEDDSLENIIEDAVETAMDMNEIDGEVYHVHICGDPHSEEVED